MRAGLLLFIVSLAACDDGGGSAGDMAIPVPHNFARINKEILQPLCANFSACHSLAGASNAGKLNLDENSVDPYAQLVGAASTNAQALAEGKPRVKPCDPDNSLVWIKLNLPLSSPPDMGYGESMPKGNPHLPDDILAAIHDWIARGAIFDEPLDVEGSQCPPDGGTDAAHD
jgi:hypothetical protein